MDRHDGESIVQVLAEFAFRNHLLQILIAGGNQSHVDRNRFASTNTLDFTFLNRAQDLSLPLRPVRRGSRLECADMPGMRRALAEKSKEFAIEDAERAYDLAFFDEFARAAGWTERASLENPELRQPS